MNQHNIAAAIAAEITRAHSGAAVLTAVAAARVAGFSFPADSRAGSRAAAALARLGVPLIRLGRRHAVRVADIAIALAGAPPTEATSDARALPMRSAGRPRMGAKVAEVGNG